MHAKEPWSYETPCPGECCWHISGANGERINYPELSEKDARRIVACVNALEGLNDYALMGGWSFKGFTAYANKVEQQRDELLTAFKAARESLDQANSMPNGPISDTIWHGPAETLFDFMDAAIAKAEAAK